MEVEVSDPNPDIGDISKRKNLESPADDRVRVKKKTLQAVLEQCQRALELLNNSNGVDENEGNYASGDGDEDDQLGEADEVWRFFMILKFSFNRRFLVVTLLDCIDLV